MVLAGILPYDNRKTIRAVGVNFFSTHRVGHHIALVVGLGAATFLTLPGLPDALVSSLEAALWICLAFFGLALLRTLRFLLHGDRSMGGLAELVIDAVAVIPAPTALA